MTAKADDLLTADEFAGLAKVTTSAVRKWKARGVGPKPIQPEGTRIVRYRRRDVEAWMNGESDAAEVAL